MEQTKSSSSQAHIRAALHSLYTHRAALDVTIAALEQLGKARLLTMPAFISDPQPEPVPPAATPGLLALADATGASAPQPRPQLHPLTAA